MRTLSSCHQAVNEIEVFLRAIGETQRHWAKRIAAQEAKVRRYMMIEDHCRKKLRKSVLRVANVQLKYLVSTDPLGSMEVKLPPPGAFNAFHIPTERVSGFSVFVMARLHVFPTLLSDVPRINFIADLLTAWEILPPSRKEAYELIAKRIREFGDGAPRRAFGEGAWRSSCRRCEVTNGGDDLVAAEARAYGYFVRRGKEQLQAAVGPMRNALWSAIAAAEWGSLTKRQRRCFLPP
ncbi:hypothetical protein ERJ75_000163300 [Trypanosoma vivax]|nr:hypothetical protein ERJ75_000163300 [Trypanosoma vivax]